MDKAITLMNDLSAHMCDLSPKEYVERHEELMSKIKKVRQLAQKVKVKNAEQFREGYTLKGLISSLYCYVFNNDKKDENGKSLYPVIAEIEGIVGKKLFTYARRYKRIKDKETRAVAKYVITNALSYCMGEEREKIIRKLLAENVLFQAKDTYLVTGLHYAVGDNVFTYDRNNRSNRNYIGSCAIQAFYINNRFCDYIKEHNIEVPPLPEEYKTASTGDHKGCSRVYLSKKQNAIIYRNYTNF